MRCPASLLPRTLQPSGAREGAPSLRNRVDSERRNDIQTPAIVAPRRPEGTHGLPAPASPRLLVCPHGCRQLQPAAIQNP